MKKPKKKKRAARSANVAPKKKQGRKAEPFNLTGQQRREIEKAKSNTNDHRLRCRLLALTWLDQGKSEQEVADLLDLSRKTIHNWRKTYRRHGLAKLLQIRLEGDPGELTAAQIAQLKDEVKTGRFHCALGVQSWLQDTFNVCYSISGTKNLLRRIGCSFHKTSGFLFKADHDEQQTWQAKYQKQRADNKDDPSVLTFTGDAVHLLWGLEIIFSCWLLKGQRLNVGVGSGRKRFNVLGAYCPDGHEYVDVRSTSNVNALTLIELMKAMREKYPLVKKFIIYLDNAKYNHAKMAKEWIQEQQKEGVTFVLDHLPAYSPNLNLIERVWKLLRKKAMRKWHKTFEDMQAAITDVLDNLHKYKDELDTLMTENFHLVAKKDDVAIPA